jgi:hypothetical protein
MESDKKRRKEAVEQRKTRRRNMGWHCCRRCDAEQETYGNCPSGDSNSNRRYSACVCGEYNDGQR